MEPVPQAKYLDLILYSREQLLKEYADMPSKAGGDTDPEQLLPNVPWGIIRWGFMFYAVCFCGSAHTMSGSAQASASRLTASATVLTVCLELLMTHE